uniref:Putative secreted peptide n=1 Tax=Anopheles braziliensis TaxID=58242 RepID=A0A2M3ZPD9_9DIPT
MSVVHFHTLTFFPACQCVTLVVLDVLHIILKFLDKKKNNTGELLLMLGARLSRIFSVLHTAIMQRYNVSGGASSPLATSSTPSEALLSKRGTHQLIGFLFTRYKLSKLSTRN